VPEFEDVLRWAAGDKCMKEEETGALALEPIRLIEDEVRSRGARFNMAVMPFLGEYPERARNLERMRNLLERGGYDFLDF